MEGALMSKALGTTWKLDARTTQLISLYNLNIEQILRKYVLIPMLLHACVINMLELVNLSEWVTSRYSQ
jgi:hypothetical protein